MFLTSAVNYYSKGFCFYFSFSEGKKKKKVMSGMGVGRQAEKAMFVSPCNRAKQSIIMIYLVLMCSTPNTPLSCTVPCWTRHSDAATVSNCTCSGICKIPWKGIVIFGLALVYFLTFSPALSGHHRAVRSLRRDFSALSPSFLCFFALPHWSSSSCYHRSFLCFNFCSQLGAKAQVI